MFFRPASTAVKARLEPIKTEIKAAEPQTVELHESAKECVYEKKDVGEDQNQYVRMASKISNNDLDFLALLEGENGLWTPDRKSKIVGANGYRDVGYCQVNIGFHPEIYFDKRFKDPQWQLEQCYRLYKGGTKFYADKNIPINRDKFICQ